MINKALLNPESIVVVGGSNELFKPGGKLVKNLLECQFPGELYIVNPKELMVQGVKCYNSVQELPNVDLAFLAISPINCLEAVEILVKTKSTKAVIILSAGFSEESEAGKLIEDKIVDIINKYNACLIGPNCIGFLNENYAGIFTSPVPVSDKSGCDLISASGATAVMIMEAGILRGLRFNEVYSLGNSAQTGIEEVVQYLDESYTHGFSAPIKLLYIEQLKDIPKLKKNLLSLVAKGCKVIAIKSGTTTSGQRAAKFHTGAKPINDSEIEELFKNCNIIRCYSKEEIIGVCSILMHPTLCGKNIAIITHAGGPGVMLSDALQIAGLNVPEIEENHRKVLLKKMNSGSSAYNPIDFLATGNEQHLSELIDYCEHQLKEIDGMIVVFGNPGLFSVIPVFSVIDQKMETCKKPIYTVLPSVLNAKEEIGFFTKNKRIYFPDEVLLAQALGKVYVN